MGDLTAEHFPEYFYDVHGQRPFPWQSRLTTKVFRDGCWPEVIDLPTGTGKTAVLDTAIFALAARPERSARRIVFVIDRRIVVDQVYERAKSIKQKIAGAHTPLLQLVRDRLALVSSGQPLDVAILRGGIPIDRDWVQRPDQPWVMVSTVDQFGSRLLFRGYGVTKRMRPIYAGLTGNDCLVILDEVHLSRAFAQTLAEVKEQHFGESLPPRRFQVVQMSATAEATQPPFTLEEADLHDSAELCQRAQAPKSALLRHVPGTRKPHVAIPAEVKKILGSELGEPVRTVGVIVNRVRTARETHRELVDAGYVAHLITGRMRPLDRELVLSEVAEVVDPDSRPGGAPVGQVQPTPDGTNDAQTDASEVPAVPRVVVATQAIEVGADFSFDALITEAAPIDSLRQRFGRLDRRGFLASDTGKPAQAWIVGVQSALQPKYLDPVYGDTARRTWEELKQLTARTEDGALDFSPRSPVPANLSSDCRAPYRNAPLLLETYMNAWVQTDPEPITQPTVDWFLHGIEDEQREGEVSIVWRHDHSHEVLRLVPPRSAEFLDLPIGAARMWLEGASGEIEVADVPTARPFEPRNGAWARGSDWCRWLGRDEPPEPASDVDELRPGDVLIVEPSRGGIEHATWAPGAMHEVEDLGDEAQAAHQRNFTLRLDERLYATLDGLSRPPSPRDAEIADERLRDRVDSWLQELLSHPRLPSSKAEFIRRIRDEGFERPLPVGREISGSDNRYYVLTSRDLDPGMMDGSDETSSVTGSEVTLRRHLVGVADKVVEYAQRLGLSTELQSDLRLAAGLHDLGKVDTRFQRQLAGGVAGGDEVKQVMIGEPLAKSLRGVRPPRNGWPPVRHEVMSVAMAQSNDTVLDEAHDRDLVLHLIGTHHGVGRAIPTIEQDKDAEVLRFEHDGHQWEASTDLADSALALEMADRFWRLNERYGYHGLAWLETILRLADQQRSAEEANESEAG